MEKTTTNETVEPKKMANLIADAHVNWFRTVFSGASNVNSNVKVGNA